MLYPHDARRVSHSPSTGSPKVDLVPPTTDSASYHVTILSSKRAAHLRRMRDPNAFRCNKTTRILQSTITVRTRWICQNGQFLGRILEPVRCLVSLSSIDDISRFTKGLYLRSDLYPGRTQYQFCGATQTATCIKLGLSPCISRYTSLALMRLATLSSIEDLARITAVAHGCSLAKAKHYWRPSVHKRYLAKRCRLGGTLV